MRRRGAIERAPWRAIAIAAAMPPAAFALAAGWAAGMPDGARPFMIVAYGVLIESVAAAGAMPLFGVASMSRLASKPSGLTTRLAALGADAVGPIAAFSLLSFALDLWRTPAVSRSIGTAVTAHLVLAAALALFWAIGAAAASRVRHTLDAALAASAVSCLFAVGSVAAGARLVAWSGRALNAMLLLTPPVAVGAAADVDVLHLDAIYRVSPLAHVQFAYPAWPASATAYLTIATAVLVAAALVSRPSPHAARADARP
jgi:hypothetical protein